MKKINTRLLYACILILALACMTVSTAQAQISIVIGKSSIHKAGLDDLKQMFNGTKITWANGNKVHVADQSESELGKRFYEKFIGKSAIQVRTQWMKLFLSGQASAPLKCNDDASVKKAVADDPNMVGYISSASLDNTVKEIGRIE